MNKKIEMIYPIIIDENINHEDDRLPKWLRENTNIQYISKPEIAARKINSRLIEISWKIHPRLKERKEIFVGRNEKIKNIEERLDDYSLPTPACMICSGLLSIGRKALLTHSLIKSNIIRESFNFPTISLTSQDSIEDFIIKINDLGLTSIDNITQKLNDSFHNKIILAKSIVDSIYNEKERILIEDHGVIVQGDGNIVDWFSEIINYIADKEYLMFIISSKNRTNLSLNRVNPFFFSLTLAEMEATERNGLLKRYADFEQLNLSRDELSFFSDILTGYPEQVFFAVDMIKEKGLNEARKQSHIIQQYGADKAKIVLDFFKDDKDSLDLIYLISRFEFLSYDLLFEIVDENKYAPLLEKIFRSSVCEKIGTTPDYFRVSEVIRDYVSRNNFGEESIFENKIKEHIKKFADSIEKNGEYKDLSDYFFSAQEILKTKSKVPDSMLIPSVFVKTIKQLYNEKRNYTDALELANRVLSKEKSIHENTISQVRFVKCQCLARLKDSEFFAEVRKLKEPDASFLHGFYYRLSGNYKKALESLNRALDVGKRDPKVLSELILVYMQNEEFDLAYNLAKENYENRPSSPINANNYFTCLISREKNNENLTTLREIIKKLQIDSSERAQEMVESAKARLIAYYDEKEDESLNVIDAAIIRFPDVTYPALTKAEISAHFNNKNKLSEAVIYLDKIKRKYSPSLRTIVKYKAILLAMQGQIDKAKGLVNKELNGLSKTSQDRLLDKLKSFYEINK
ncbi:hypothetical protein LHK94_11650 [Dickeya zeae]|uniref:tetratricopeptide repeat protein n=1 Tax=Dickeya zeae TaxID=204042 RepID=UPI001CF9E8D2|nr:hypothetical protein [Dickeya zeae]UCZ73714.1 hypothetical protein LHK94_11650 [Dickeya zeae]